MQENSKQRQLTQLQYMLFHLGLTQVQAAKELNISPNTVCKWVKQNGWRNKLQGRKRLVAANTMRFDDSLSAFMVFIKKKHPDLVPPVSKAYKNFLKPL